jgi:hypothetical protein
MKIFTIINNPLFKIAGIGLIVYYGLFSDKSTPESLGNRLSSKNLEKDFNEVKEKSRFIVTNVGAAQQAVTKTNVILPDQTQNSAQVSTSELEIGKGDEVVACGDEVEISYGIYTQDNKQLEFVKQEKLIISSNHNPLIEQNIIGMKQDGIRNLNFPQNFISGDKKLGELINFNKSAIRYQVTLLSLVKSAKPQIACQQ